MTRTFTVSVPPGSRTLRAGADGRAQVAYTVANKKPTPARARVRVAARDSSRDEWFQVEGDAERDFRAEEAQVFTVRVAIPRDVPAGTYGFRLDAVSVADPQEDFTEGDSIAVEWTPPPVTPRPRLPWWLIPAAAGVVAIVVGVVVWRLWPEPEPVEDPPEARQVLMPSEQPVDLAEGSNEHPSGIALSSGGRWLAIAGHNEVRLRDLRDGNRNTPSVRLQDARERFLTPSLQGDWLFTSGGSDGLLWSLENGSPVSTDLRLDPQDEGISVGDAAFSRDGKRLAVVCLGTSDAVEPAPPEGSSIAAVTLWNLESRFPTRLSRWAFVADRDVHLDFSPDGLSLATAHDGQPPRIWDVRTASGTAPTGRNVGRPENWSGSRIELLRFVGDGRWLVVGTAPISDEDHDAVHTVSLQLWDVSSTSAGSPVPLGVAGIDPFFEEEQYVAVSGNGRWMVSGQAGSPAVLLDFQAAPDVKRREIATSSGGVNCAAFGADDAWLAVGGNDSVSLYDLTGDGTAEPQKRNTPAAVQAVACDPSDKWMAAVCKSDGETDPSAPMREPVIRLWELKPTPVTSAPMED